MHKCHITFFLMGLFATLNLWGCASSPTPAPATPAVPPLTPAVEVPAPEPVPTPAPQPELPKISPEIQALRESMAQQNMALASMQAHAIVDAHPKSLDAAEALRTLAEIHMHEGKMAEAQLYADAAYAIHPQDAQTLIRLAKLAIVHQQSDVAMKHLKAAAEIIPDDPQPHIMQAHVLLQFLDTERALSVAKTAYKLAPQHCHAAIVYADALYASRIYPDAVTQYETARAQNCPIGEDTLKNIAKLYEVHVQDPPKACEAYKRLHEIDPHNPYYKASMDYQCKNPS